MTELYPLKFKTIFKDKIWGGQKIKTILDKDFGSLPNCGETWEISGVEGNISEVAEGPLTGKNLKQLIQEYQHQLVGSKVYQQFGDEFPLLVKFIDANDDLSIQVHPDDKLAKARHNSFGKTEMWYVFQADPGSKLIAGFNQPMSKEKYLEYFKNGKLTEILNQEDVNNDDVFFLPAGRVHTIGKGLLLAEIQQTSDITYRIYDFDRKDAHGKTRELHVDEALDAIDYQHYDHYKTQYVAKRNEPVQLVSCPYFETNRLEFTKDTKMNYQHIDSFIIYVCMEGEAQIVSNGKNFTVKKGDSYLLPASIEQVELLTKQGYKMLESYVP